jgi:dipeptidyl aminopeptidase/acylaminoacyl peptidase
MVSGLDARAGALAVAVSGPTTLTEIVAVVDGVERQLTNFTKLFAPSVGLTSPERFVARSKDGSEVEAWVMRPIGAEPGARYPTLLNVHGGPFTQYGNHFFDEFQMQAGAGYAVVYCNPRGSSGYSEAWGRAIRGPSAAVDPGSGWGGVDYEDVMAAIETAVEQFDFIDPGRVGVLGGSYGGYMTSWIIGHTDRFKAACSERSVNDVGALELFSDIAGTFRHELGVDLFDAPEEYAHQSPMTYVQEMRTPLLILHSENDLRCPVDQADRLYVALRLLGREPEFWRFPGEGHELSRSGSPRHRVRRQEIILDFFDRHLKG